MMNLAPAEVKGIVRSQHAPTRQIPFAFRAEPVALDGMKLPRTARQLFTLLLDNAKGRGWKSRLSNGTLARILGCCEMTIGRALVALEKAGLIRRELIAGGRIRLAIHVVWDGVQQTVRPCVQQSGGTGSTVPLEGSNIPVGHTSVPSQSERRSDGGSSPLDGKQAAAYLKACVAAGRRGDPMPEPPRGGYSTPPPSPNGIMIHDTPAATPVRNPDTLPPNGVLNQYTLPTTPVAPPGAFLPSVGRMVASLGERLKADGCGPRRVGPAKLARQLGEMRRKHGKRE